MYWLLEKSNSICRILWKINRILRKIWRLKSKKNLEALDPWLQLARPSQKVPEGDWRIWIIMAGRGFGKTRTGSETVRLWAESGTYRRIALVGDTLQEVRRVMLEGESGLLNIAPEGKIPSFNLSKRTLAWRNGAMATLMSASRPEQFRGPQFDAVWIDELAKFQNDEETFNQILFALRLGACPRIIITTTPRPTPFIRKLLSRPDVVVTRGSTFENAENLAPGFLETMTQQFVGTRLGRQELEGEILSDDDTQIWTPCVINRLDVIPSLDDVVLAVDPAVTSDHGSHETGIVVAGRSRDGQLVVLGDYSCRLPLKEWGAKVVRLVEKYRVNRVIVENNQGGEVLINFLRSVAPRVTVKGVRATVNKMARAQPIGLLYEQGKVVHAYVFSGLEEQMLAFPEAPDDRVDALVWALHDLQMASSKDKIASWKVWTS